MRGDSELRTRRSRVQRLQRQSAVFAVRRLVKLSMGAPSGNPCASSPSGEYVGCVTG
jgi:hypothetical protein